MERGDNALAEQPPSTIWAQLWGQCHEVVVWLLLAAAVLAAFLGEWVDTAAILAIADALGAGEAQRDSPAVTNVRHAALLAQALASLNQGLDALAAGFVSEELVLADLQAARGALEEISGRRTADDVLAAIFRRFCIGK